MLKLVSLTLVAVLVIPALVYTNTIVVPDDHPTIQGAIDAALNGDTVLVKPGTYVENIVFGGKAITVISEEGAQQTVIDGNQTGSVVKFKNAEGPDSVLDGFTVLNGTGTKVFINGKCGGGILCRADASPTIKNNIISQNHADYGAGIFGDQCSPTIVNNTIRDNTAVLEGAGLLFEQSASPVISNNIIEENTASLWGGGLEYYSNCSVNVTDNIFRGNAAINQGGGGIVVALNCTGIVSDNLFIENTGYRAGGVYIQDVTELTITKNMIRGNSCTTHGAGMLCKNSSPDITENIFCNNTAGKDAGGMLCNHSSAPLFKNNYVYGNTAGLWGGGIEFCWSCSPTIDSNVIINNIALAQWGGGITMGHDCTGTIANNIIAGNQANGPDGGGGGIEFEDGCSLDITNNLIYGNRGTRGGGVDLFLGSFAIMSNNTIYGNTATVDGGGITCRNNSGATLANTILWDNSAATGSEISIVDQSTVNIDYSNLLDGMTSVHVEPGSTLNWGTHMIDLDPLFTTGPCGFFYLCQLASGQTMDSPCMDSGSDLAANLGMGAYCTRTDEVPDSGMVDMGYHYGSFLYPALQVDVFSIPENTGGTANFLLLAGTDNALRNYLLVGGVSGTVPGLPLPGGMATLPVNWDIFSDLVMALLNSPVFSNFMGKLDAEGMGSAQLNLPAVPGTAGLIMHYAFCCNNPFDFVSNPIAIEMVP